MIAKTMNRVDFGGLVNYAHNDKSQTKRANLLAHEGVCITDNKTIADSFYVQATMRPNRKKPVKHIALSFSPRDAERFPDNEEGDALMAEIAKEWLKRMQAKKSKAIEPPSIPQTLKDLPRFIFLTYPWYWIKKMYRSEHFRQFLVICMACAFAVSVSLTILLVYDNAQLRKVNNIICKV